MMRYNSTKIGWNRPDGRVLMNASLFYITAKAERIAKEKAEAKRRAQKRAALLAEQNELQTELSQLKGLFSGKRRKEIEARLAELSTALRELEEKA